MRMPLAEPLRRRTYNTLHRDLCQSPACDADFVRHRIPYDATRTISLPKLPPCSRPMKASAIVGTLESLLISKRSLVGAPPAVVEEAASTSHS